MKIKSLIFGAIGIIAMVIYWAFFTVPTYTFSYPWQGYAYQTMEEYAQNFGLPVDQMDSNAFSIISDGLAHDDNFIYVGNKILPYESYDQLLEQRQDIINTYQANLCPAAAPWDLQTLEILDVFGNIARDQNQTYINCRPLTIPREKIQVLARYLHTDGQTLFNQTTPAEISLEGFKNLGYGYVKDVNHIYTQQPGSAYSRLDNVDTASFQPINRHFAKDQNHYYYQTQPLANIDHATFKPFLRHAVDKNRAYYFYNAQQVNLTYSTDYDTYEVLDNYYAKDKNHLYYENLRVPNIDPAQIFYNEFGVITDGIHAIIDGDIVIGSDPETFQQFQKTPFAKDKNQVYFNGIRIVGADPKTFTIIPTAISGLNYAKDARGCFKDNLRSRCPTKKEMENA